LGPLLGVEQRALFNAYPKLPDENEYENDLYEIINRLKDFVERTAENDDESGEW
jgi:hypothetical protein